ncbi:response regulator transcription factor [Chitinophaga sp. GbtcB8]|uniref:response regulator transcription factor n=1 Tax=Chitinophaga sp. GbtcB8 TaxID=2824753 RepID=UPI001C305961|nr:response regulator transcription factor [Chitinophaga sp. GbtcB8]
MPITIGLVDDHQLFLKSLTSLLQSFDKYEVVLEALNGKDMQDKLRLLKTPPDLMLIDVNMPVMNGVDTANWISENYPVIKLIALSMNDSDASIINMLRAGCCAYLLKDSHPTELEKALDEVQQNGYYNSDNNNINYGRLMMKANKEKDLKLTVRELEFIQHACSDMTYKEIANKMNVSERTVDGYRETLFQKLNVQSRVGLCMEALRREFVKL